MGAESAQQRRGWEKGQAPNWVPELHTTRGPRSYGAPPPPALGHVQEVVVCVTVCSSGLLLPGSTFFLTPSQRHHLADASTFRGRCSILRVGSCEERLAARALKQQPPLTSWLPPLTASVFSKFPWSGSLLCDWAEGAGGLELLRGGLQAGRGAQEFPRAAQRPGNRPV